MLPARKSGLSERAYLLSVAFESQFREFGKADKFFHIFVHIPKLLKIGFNRKRILWSWTRQIIVLSLYLMKALQGKIIKSK